MSRLPTLFVPHGGGPCFFLKPGELFPPGTWDRMADYLRRVSTDVGVRPAALLIVSAHWEEAVPTTYAPSDARLLYDYYGFPPASYELQYPAKASPELAVRVRELLNAKNIPVATDSQRGFDHGVFVPMKLVYPEADIPIVQLSLCEGLDVGAHLAVGRAIAPLRDEGVLILGSGMSYHNLRALGTPAGDLAAHQFDTWLNGAITDPDPEARARRLREWPEAPGARSAHPRPEHLAPLFVVAGAAEKDQGWRSYSDVVFGKAVSGFQFGSALRRASA